jgi:hypothetical protein
MVSALRSLNIAGMERLNPVQKIHHRILGQVRNGFVLELRVTEVPHQTSSLRSFRYLGNEVEVLKKWCGLLVRMPGTPRRRRRREGVYQPGRRETGGRGAILTP